MIFQIVYASIATSPLSGNGLPELLNRSRGKNVHLGITGLLLHKHGSFVQVLEGEETAVHSLYATIRKDQRHHHVVTLATLPVAKRQFPNWTMGFKDLDDPQIGSIPGYYPNPLLPTAHDELSWQASAAKGLLATFEEEK